MLYIPGMSDRGLVPLGPEYGVVESKKRMQWSLYGPCCVWRITVLRIK